MDGMKNIELVTLADMVAHPELYWSLADQLTGLPCPSVFMVERVPEDIEQFTERLSYGQKYFMTAEEKNDVNVIIRYIGGYFFPLLTSKPWVESECLKWCETIKFMPVVDLYPITFRLTELMLEVVEREKKLLERKPSKQEQAAGIEKLNKFADLSAVKFLQREFGISREAVMQLPYNDCLVEFLYNHELQAYEQRLAEIYRKENEDKAKNKYK